MINNSEICQDLYVVGKKQRGSVMANILDYLKWRGDIPFTMIPFNEIDGLILSELSYIYWRRDSDGYVNSDLKTLYKMMRNLPYTRQISSDEDKQLFSLCAESIRFGDITVVDYQTDTDEKVGKQFAAVTFYLPDNTAFIAFRGTDGTIVGWEEDCNLAFSDPIPAQVEATQYLSKIARQYPYRLRVGGHSKGGNMAVFSACSVSKEIRDRITTVYNYDGPGLSDRIEATIYYSRIADIMEVYVPQSSMIGMLLSHAQNVAVVAADSHSVFQHNPYYWHVKATGFELTERSKDSEFVESVIHKWLRTVDDNERRMIIDAIFRVIKETNAISFNREILFKLTQNPLLIGRALQSYTSEDKKKVLRKLIDLSMFIHQEASNREKEFIQDTISSANDKLKELIKMNL